MSLEDSARPLSDAICAAALIAASNLVAASISKSQARGSTPENQVAKSAKLILDAWKVLRPS